MIYDLIITSIDSIETFGTLSVRHLDDFHNCLNALIPAQNSHFLNKIMPNYRSDFSFWNLDWLNPRKNIQMMGMGQVVSIPNISKCFIKQVSILNRGELLLLIPDKRIIQMIEPGTKNIYTVYEWSENENLIDMAVIKDRIYVLDLAGKRIALIKKEVQNTNKFKISTFWSIQEHKLLKNSRVAVYCDEKNNANKVYITPVNDNEILLLDIDDDSSKYSISTQSLKFEIDKKQTNSKQKIGSEIHLCLDDVKESLIITDTQNNRILEADCKTGMAEVICGTEHLDKSKNVISKDGLAPFRVGLNSPKSTVIYRPSKLISLGYLCSTSKKIIESDKTGVKPRTLIIADSGNNRILKLIELPRTHYLAASSNQRKVFTLLGGGKYPIERFSSSIDDNFKGYKIDEPIGLAVSAIGELLVWKKNISILTLLRPATAFTDLKIYKGSLKNNLQDS